jgi:hypothetical protein
MHDGCVSALVEISLHQTGGIEESIRITNEI